MLVTLAATVLLAVLCMLCIHTLDRVTRRIWHYKHLRNCSGQRITLPNQQILQFKKHSGEYTMTSDVSVDRVIRPNARPTHKPS